MEKINILGPNNVWEDSSVLDEAIKEVIKKKELKDDQCNNGSIRKNKRKARELAPDELQ